MQCSACGRENRAGARFCDGCGGALTPVTAPEAPAVPEHLAQKIRDQRALEGERKQVTVLFADVMGSMDLAEGEDPEAWREVMARFFAILCDGVHRFEGTVDKFTGDGIMALFGAPIAHEDHAVRACYASMHLHRGLAGYADELRRTRGLNFSVRIGLHSGEVVVGAIGDDLSLDYTAIGHTVGLAQRMEALAAPGTTYLTDPTAQLVTGFVELRDLGEFAIKGASAPVRVHELAGAGAARTRLDLSRGRGFSRFVGRAEEMAELEGALERAAAGAGCVVGVVGEAGVGKSRLCEEFAQRAATRGLPVYRAAAASHALNVPFQTALELLRDFFGIGAGDDDRTARERVAGRLLLLDGSFTADLPLLFDFLGIPDPEAPVERMDPQARSRQLLDLGARVVRAQSVAQAGVTVIEDLHWLDPASGLMLDALVDSVAGTGSLIVLNFRPEFEAPWMARDHYLGVELVPLSAEASRELLDHLLGGDPSLDGLHEELYQRTGGNPFFIEEVVRGLAEEERLVGAPGDYRLAGPVDSVAVPRSVQSVLAARIDRLAPEDKALLQSASVVGREFPESMLRLLGDRSEAALASSVTALTDAGFLTLDSIYPEREFSFRHPLTQEVAYGSQLSDRRAREHAAVARALVELHAEDLDERASLIAHHWEAAHEPLEAARWHARAGVWAGNNDVRSAATHWRRVRELVGSVGEDPETLALGVAARLWGLMHGWRLGMPSEEAAALYTEGRALAERAGDDVSRALVMGSYAGLIGVGGEAATSDAIMAETEPLLDALPIDVQLAMRQYFSYRRVVRAEFATVASGLERDFELAREASVPGIGVTSPRSWLHFLHAVLLTLTGQLERAGTEIERGLATAREHGDVETEGWLHMGRAWQAAIRAEPEAAVAAARRASELAERIGSDFSRVWAIFYLGVAAQACGEHGEAVDRIELAIRMADERRTGIEQRSLMLGYLALSRLGLGDLDGALADAVEARERGVADNAWLGWCAAARALVAIHTAAGRLDEAAQVLREGRAYLQRVGGRTLEAELLEHAVDLARARRDREAEAVAAREAIEAFEAIGAPRRAEALAGGREFAA